LPTTRLARHSHVMELRYRSRPSRVSVSVFPPFVDIQICYPPYHRPSMGSLTFWSALPNPRCPGSPSDGPEKRSPHFSGPVAIARRSQSLGSITPVLGLWAAVKDIGWSTLEDTAWQAADMTAELPPAITMFPGSDLRARRSGTEAITMVEMRAMRMESVEYCSPSTLAFGP